MTSVHRWKGVWSWGWYLVLRRISRKGRIILDGLCSWLRRRGIRRCIMRLNLGMRLLLLRRGWTISWDTIRANWERGASIDWFVYFDYQWVDRSMWIIWWCFGWKGWIWLIWWLAYMVDSYGGGVASYGDGDVYGRLYRSCDFLFVEDFLKCSVAHTWGTYKSWDGDEVGFSEIDGAILIELNIIRSTSQMESMMEEWSLEGTILSV